MTGFIVKAYRDLMPQSWRDKVYRVFLRKTLNIIRTGNFLIKTKWFYFLSCFIVFSNEKYKAWSFLGRYGKTQNPGIDILQYENVSIEIFIDQENKMPFIIHHNKRLYFPLKYKDNIENIYKTLLIEQDEKSAHRYVDSYTIFNGKIMLDIGAAEGILALEVIDYVDYLYIFECEHDWINALKATFSPWENKVEVIEKFVSDIDDENNITLDSFFRDKNIDNIFIKMDIEGAEYKALQGASFVLSNAKNLDFSICLYHHEDDYIVIPEYLEKYGYKCVTTKGYLLIDWWLRKGVIRNI